MIRNIVFDMGGVLVEFRPKAFLEELGFAPEALNGVYETMFRSPLWLELDRGTYTFEEAVPLFIKMSPHLEAEIRQVLNVPKDKMLSPMEGSAEFLIDLKKQGYRIFVLSNFTQEGFAAIKQHYDYIHYVDEAVISSDIHMMKPEPEIYTYMLEKLKIRPEETIFIDDLEVNLAPARALGIHTVQFTTLDEVKEKVGALLHG